MTKFIRSLFFPLLILCFTIPPAAASSAGPERDSTICLEIEGKVSNADQNGTPCRIEIIRNDTLVDSIILKNGKRKFIVQFRRNQHYTIRIMKEGFQNKSICVHTDMQFNNGVVYEFYFETTMFFSKPSVEEQPPIATIYYNAKRNCFYYTRTNPYVPGKANCIKAP